MQVSSNGEESTRETEPAANEEANESIAEAPKVPEMDESTKRLQKRQ